MKKIVSALLLALLLLTMFVPAYADDFEVYPAGDNGDYFMTMDITPFIENGRTYLPVRFVAEPFGIRTSWNAATQTVTLDRGRTTARLVIGSKTITIGEGPASSALLMDVAPILRNGRTFLPVRYVADAFGLTTTWLQAQQAVRINEGVKSLNFKIGSKSLVVSDGHFLKLQEWNDFRFAYPYNAVLKKYSATEVSYAFSDPAYSDREVRLTITPVMGTVLEDMTMDSIKSYMNWSAFSTVYVYPTTFYGRPALNYDEHFVYSGGGRYGIAFFHGSNLVCMESSLNFERDYNVIPVAKKVFEEIMPALTLK